MAIVIINDVLERICKFCAEQTRKESLVDEYFDQFHVLQKSSWDCGIACCSMVFNWYDHVNSNDMCYFNDNQIIRGNNPLWTIELFNLLKEHEIHCEFFSTCLGTGPHHETLTWYSDNHKSMDLAVLKDSINRAEANEWQRAIQQHKLSLDSLKNKLSTGSTAAIMLVNGITLRNSLNGDR